MLQVFLQSCLWQMYLPFSEGNKMENEKTAEELNALLSKLISFLQEEMYIAEENREQEKYEAIDRVYFFVTTELEKSEK